jgi:hypothetical protein
MMVRTAALTLMVATITAGCGPAVSDSLPAPSVTVTEPGPTVTVTEPAELMPPERMPTEEQARALADACDYLDEIPPFDLLIDYEPEPNSDSLDRTRRVAKEFSEPAQFAIDLIFAADAQKSDIGSWVLSEASDFMTVADELEFSSSQWASDPTEENFGYWMFAYGYAIYKVQERSACLNVESYYAD